MTPVNCLMIAVLQKNSMKPRGRSLNSMNYIYIYIYTLKKSNSRSRKNIKFISISELIFIYCGLFVLILVGFLCFFSSHYVSAKFHLWPSSGD